MKTWMKALCALLLPLALMANAAAAPQTENDEQKAFEEARAAGTTGPADVKLGTQGVLKLPAGHLFVPQPQAQKLLLAMGNPGERETLQGLVFPTAEGEGGSWFAVVNFEPEGYVKDDDAKDWNADDLLKSFREGTAAANAERVRMGVPELEIVGWAERPAYDAKTHRLVWAMASREKGQPDAGQGVNYNTYALGRDGYFTLNLVTELKDLPAHKAYANALLAGLNYNDGKRYADFNKSTDKMAEYGLAALVVGVGAKKLGLFALAAAFALKFAKLLILGVAGLGAVVMRLFKRRGASA
jgi:uncharacterized membrane-anchored protein